MHTAATEAAVTAAETATHATTETAVRFASEAAAMHTSAEAGLAAEGVLVDHATVVESAECAGVAAPLHVRRSESTIGSMVEVILVAIKIATVEIAAVGKSVTVVKKGMAMGKKPSVVKNHETTAPVAAPEAPAPRIGKKADGITKTERHIWANEEIDVARVHCQRSAVHHPRIVGGNIDDLRIRRFDDYRLPLRRHLLLLRGVQCAGGFRSLAHNLDGVHNLLRVIVVSVS